MPTFDYNVKLTEKSKFEADLKMSAGTRLMKRLPVSFLERMAFIVEHEPEKVELAKQFLGIK